MAEVSYLPFRLLCRKYGAALAYTEQLSALAVINENKKTLELAKTIPEEKPVGLQLFGRNPESLVNAAKKLEKNFDIIDLNFGCPSKKIVQQGYGSALLKEKEKIFEIINTLANNITKPVTVKMRSGFKKVEALELAKVMEKAGASAITIHARTQEQGYSGEADWSIIKQVKEKTSIPIIGNGDVTTPQSAEELLNQTKCDYIMIGSAAKINPWIFKQILHYLNTGEILEQNKEEKIDLFFEYCKLDTMKSVKIIRDRAIDFTRGIPRSAKIREKIGHMKNIEGIKEALSNFAKE